MLAIMNIGKYSSSGTVPSGSDLFTITASQSLGQAIDFFAKKGNTILALPYEQNTIYRSSDGGATWLSVSMSYYIAHILYSPIKDKFYALELGDKDTTELHYGVSDNGIDWTWESLLTISAQYTHIYGTFIEEVGNDIAFDVLKIEPSEAHTQSDAAVLSHIRVFTNGDSEIIGNTAHVGVSTTPYTDVYWNPSQGKKTKTALKLNLLYSVGSSTTFSNVYRTIGAWGVDNETAYSGSGYTSLKCFDLFYATSQAGSSSNYTTRYIYSPTTRNGTWVSYQTPTRTQALTFDKIYGFFQLGNYYYMAYQDNTATKWYRAGDVTTLINVAIADTFNKADLTGVPVSEYSLDNKHFLLSMADGKIYLCEAT